MTDITTKLISGIAVWILSMIIGGISYVICVIVLLFVIEDTMMIVGISMIFAIIVSVCTAINLLYNKKRGMNNG